jgi:hypothetical protein
VRKSRNARSTNGGNPARHPRPRPGRGTSRSARAPPGAAHPTPAGAADMLPTLPTRAPGAQRACRARLAGPIVNRPDGGPAHCRIREGHAAGARQILQPRDPHTRRVTPNLAGAPSPAARLELRHGFTRAADRANEPGREVSISTARNSTEWLSDCSEIVPEPSIIVPARLASAFAWASRSSN